MSTTEIVLAIIGAVLGSNALFSLIQDRLNNKDEKDEDKKLLHKLEKDSVRLQMLLLMADYPDEVTEILKLAEYYFRELKANWYMTTMFQSWLDDHNIPSPIWFQGERRE